MTGSWFFAFLACGGFCVPLSHGYAAPAGETGVGKCEEGKKRKRGGEFCGERTLFLPPQSRPWRDSVSPAGSVGDGRSPLATIAP